MRRALLAATALLVLPLSACTNEFKDTCETELEGVYKEDSKLITTTVIDSKGRPAVGTSVVTIMMCLKDGRVVAQG